MVNEPLIFLMKSLKTQYSRTYNISILSKSKIYPDLQVTQEVFSGNRNDFQKKIPGEGFPERKFVTSFGTPANPWLSRRESR